MSLFQVRERPFDGGGKMSSGLGFGFFHDAILFFYSLLLQSVL